MRMCTIAKFQTPLASSSNKVPTLQPIKQGHLKKWLYWTQGFKHLLWFTLRFWYRSHNMKIHDISLTDSGENMLHTCVWNASHSPDSNSVNPSGHSEHCYHSVCHQGRDLENCGTPSIGCPHNPSGTPHTYMSPAEKHSFLLKHG
jgi:hypothetical protein